MRLLENKLFAEAVKYEWRFSTVSFLVFIIEQGQLKPAPKNIQAVLDWPEPTNCEQLQ